MRERAGQGGRFGREADRLERALDPLVRVRAVAVQERREDALARAPQRQLHVVAHAEVDEDRRRLELAADAERRDLVLTHLDQVGVMPEDHAPAGRLHSTRDHVEQRRLAGAVRTDDDAELLAIHEEVEAAQRLEAVVVDGDVFTVDDGACGRHGAVREGAASLGSTVPRRPSRRHTRLPSRARAPRTPSGKNNTTPMKSAPRNRSQTSG